MRIYHPQNINSKFSWAFTKKTMKYYILDRKILAVLQIPVPYNPESGVSYEKPACSHRSSNSC
jgi:hypothetical protein